jgi:signal transduction histidine kinase
MLKLYFVFTLLSIIFLCRVQAQDRPVFLNPQSSFIFNKTCWSFYTSKDKNISADSIWKIYFEKKFKAVNADVFNGGIPDRYYWFHFKIVNTTKQTISYYIDVRSPRLNDLSLYTVNKGAVTAQIKTGDLQPFANRPYDYKNFAFPCELASGDSTDFLLYVNQVGNTFYLPVKVSPAAVFNDNIFRIYLLNGITFGILIFVAVFSFIFFVNTKYYIYFYYSLYLISSILWTMSYFGLGFQYLWPDYPRINSIAAPLMAALNLLLTIQICQSLLQIHKKDKRLFRIGNVCKVLLTLVGFFPVLVDIDKHDYTFNHAYILIFLGVVIVSVSVLFYAVIFYTVKRSPEATFYFIASIFKLVNIFNLALIELGISTALFNMELLLLGSLLLELILLSCAIAKKYRHLKINTYHAVIQAQEEERRNLAREMHDNISNTLAGIKFRYHYIINQLQKGNTSNLENELSDLYEMLNLVQRDARNISHNLMIENVQHNSLSELVQTYLANITKNNAGSESGLGFPDFHFLTNEKKNFFTADITLQIFRIIQELILNVIKHSRASAATIKISYERRFLTIIVEDNGVGMKIEPVQEGIGIKNIYSRIKLLSGRIEIKNAENNRNMPGTLVIISLPYRPVATNNQMNY